MAIDIIDDFDQSYNSFLQRATDSLWFNDGILRSIELQATEHSGPIRNVAGQTPLDTPMEYGSYTSSLPVSAVRSTNVDEHTQFVSELADAQKQCIAPRLFESIIQTADAVGNSVDARGESYYDTFLDGLDKLEIVFDDEGNHHVQIWLNPITADFLRQQNPPTEEQLTHLDEIIARKKAQFYATKRTRRLS